MNDKGRNAEREGQWEEINDMKEKERARVKGEGVKEAENSVERNDNVREVNEK